MKPASIPSVRYGGVALLFAVCGACSAAYLLRWFPWFPGNPKPMLLPVPFALLCALLFLHQWRAIIAVPLMVAVWALAYASAKMLGMASPMFLGPGFGGFIGGVGLVLCAATCYRRLFSRKYTFRGSVVGSVSALAFAPWASLGNTELDGREPTLVFAFAIWQAVVGTYLYASVYRLDVESAVEKRNGLTTLKLS